MWPRAVKYNLNGRGLRPIYDLIAVYSWQIHWDNIWIYNYLHLKELEILIKTVYYFQYDKTGYALLLLRSRYGTSDYESEIRQGAYSGGRRRRRRPDMKGICQCTKTAVANNRQKVVLQHGAWARG